AGGVGGGLARTTHGSSAAASDRGFGGAGLRGASAATEAVMEGLPWWALEGEAADAGGGGAAGGGGGFGAVGSSSGGGSGGAGLWVGFNLAAGRARLGHEDIAGGPGTGRRAAAAAAGAAAAAPTGGGTAALRQGAAAAGVGGAANVWD
ncbi:hypothetical protein Agub_g1125, partial [Astrephomene gubernaculifera]